MSFEEEVCAELTWLLRAGVRERSLRLSARSLVVLRLETLPPGEGPVRETVRAAMLAAARAAREADRPPEPLLRLVGLAAIEGVRGHGGTSSLWLAQAERALFEALGELSRP